jgi:hypothetical protein
VIPISFNASKKIVFSSWDRFLLPILFQKESSSGEPIHVIPRRSDPPEGEKATLRETSQRVDGTADRYFETKFQNPNSNFTLRQAAEIQMGMTWRIDKFLYRKENLL